MLRNKATARAEGGGYVPGRVKHRAGASCVAIIAVALAAATCANGCKRYWICEATDDAALTASLPQRLSETGLFTDIAHDIIARDVLPYRPAFELWSDGAVKRRWIALPAGARIDTADMDDWSFPRGTKLWKEFTRDGVRIETRLIEKLGDGDREWTALAYVWNDDGTDAVATPWGASDAHGTPHDVPAAGECIACHGGRRSYALGFSAIQLSRPAEPGSVDLDRLKRDGRLTQPPARPFDIPGNADGRAALGYLHANCGHCHNSARPSHDGARCFDPQKAYDFRLLVGQLGAPADTPTYRTAVGDAVQPGDPDGSKLISLVSNRGFMQQMPPLASERVDDIGVATLRLWIAGLAR